MKKIVLLWCLIFLFILVGCGNIKDGLYTQDTFPVHAFYIDGNYLYAAVYDEETNSATLYSKCNLETKDDTYIAYDSDIEYVTFTYKNKKIYTEQFGECTRINNVEIKKDKTESSDE